MDAWVLVGIATGIAFVVVLVALFAGGKLRRPEPSGPDWLLPSPVEARRVRFPLRWQGYDPEHVDVHLDALAAAYEALYISAGPTAIAHARQRLTGRFAEDPMPFSTTPEAPPETDEGQRPAADDTT